ncbi:ribonuclease 3-like protein 2 [Vigna angularis]|uniref:ribonuclease 3-like protein 2 n=1 Tax=Phaseolus angularis TaxID=3914 RepID=UPI0022B38931|nr:ribonuclease 3-like protein 2 [Vigna angularis]
MDESDMWGVVVVLYNCSELWIRSVYLYTQSIVHAHIEKNRSNFGTDSDTGDLEQQPHPVKELFKICQKMGKLLNIKSVRKETDSIAYVFVDGKFIASASAAKKDLAKLEAAKIALDTLAPLLPPTSMRPSITDMQLRAKQKLNELCQNKKWPKPEYSIAEESGPAHGKRFVCSVKITIEEEEGGFLLRNGCEKSKLKDAENSAASMMLRTLLLP